MFAEKKILVTGGTGLIGIPLVNLLLDRGAKVRVVSLDDASRVPANVDFQRLNLLHFENCLQACRDMDYVFHLAGIKGSPAMTRQKPASFFVPTITFNTNMLEAARQCKVSQYLFTSTVGVYAPAEIFHEDDVWKTFPSENDRFAGWAKRMGELQVEAYRTEFDWQNISIVRPANVYGPFDNFDPNNAMVIPSLIHRALSGEDPLVVWGDGSPIRDFIHARDVARGMLIAMEKSIHEPLNLGSGEGVTIKRVVEIIVDHLDKKPKIVWDTTKPSGDRKRLLDMTRASSYGFKLETSIETGIRETMDWYLQYRDKAEKRYNVFTRSQFFDDPSGHIPSIET